MIRILIYGGRDYEPDGNEFDWLRDIFADWDPYEIVVVSGNAKGADTLGERWAYEDGCFLNKYPANWRPDGKLDRGAGIKRNQEMLDSGIDYAVQFPGGNGTADMRRRLDKAGVQVFEYKGA